MSLEASSNSVIDTLGFPPCGLDSLVTIALVTIIFAITSVSCPSFFFFLSLPVAGVQIAGAGEKRSLPIEPLGSLLDDRDVLFGGGHLDSVKKENSQNNSTLARFSPARCGCSPCRQIGGW